MIFLEKPLNFNKKFDIVSCFVLWQNKFLLLQRQERKSEPKKWGQPAGKVGKNESLENAMIREMKEETGISLENINKHGSQEKTSNPHFFGKLFTTFLKYENFDLEYHEFVFDKYLNSKKPPKIILSKNEHCSYKWVAPEEAIKLDLMKYEERFVRRFFGIEK